MTESFRAERLTWREVSDEMRDALRHKLKGLYGASADEEAFDNLAVDKQQALLLLAHRLLELGLWDSVRSVENVYGTGGVGMNFLAWPGLLSELRRRKSFTTRFAAHRDNAGGFLERGRARASLHFLYRDEEALRWAVHFDLYNPLSSVLRHLLYEKIVGKTPGWREVRAWLRLEGKLF